MKPLSRSPSNLVLLLAAGALTGSSGATLAGCGGADAPPAQAPSAGAAAGGGAPGGVASAGTPFAPDPREAHFGSLRQLTFGGENAEAYWAWDGGSLILQSRTGDQACDRIYRMPLSTGAARPTLLPVSSGKGATTCSYFFPGDADVLYASTHLGGDACPPKPDHSQGYVWALYDTYDIFKAKADGSGVVRLTETKGYDAEATVCQKDGSVLFTSTRDGDIDLYRMDADGKNVKRLTDTPGYDGGAFFNADCSKILWRASRPQPGKELDDFKGLLAKGLVRPSKLELYVANADGSEARQVTYLNAATFAPYWHPNQKRILFSSNYGDPKGREFDIWAIDESGANLERITYAGGFDGFPMFSPDGKLLAFSSNRATAEGQHDTNVFLATWVEKGDGRAAKVEGGPAERVLADIAWLADDAREGRGVGTKGLAASGQYIEERFKVLGLSPAFDGSYRQPFPVVTTLKVDDGTRLRITGTKEAKGGELAWIKSALQPLAFSVNGEATGPLVFAGYGLVDKDLGLDDYAKKDVRGKVVLVRRFAPDVEHSKNSKDARMAAPDVQRRLGDLRRKAWAAKEKGAKAMIVVDLPEKPAGAPVDWKMPDEARMPGLVPDGYGDAGIPVVMIRRSEATTLVDELQKGAKATATVAVAMSRGTEEAFNVVGRLPAGAPAAARLPGVVVIGAHYDHLGMGEKYSLTPDAHEAHNGADDNASGTAVLLEVARALAARKDLPRDVIFASFSGEESGILGSSHFVRNLPPGVNAKDLVAMLNMDMVGRLRRNTLEVLGADSAAEWTSLVNPACDRARVLCTAGGGGYGPSDQTPFYASGVPVLHFFTGSHGDYHKASDDTDKVNAGGAGQVSLVVADVASQVAARTGRLTLKESAAPSTGGDMRSFGASLGTIPDYAGPPDKKGVLLAGVRAGSPAERAGMRRGDVMIRIGPHAVSSVEDFMYVLSSVKPGETAPIVVRREGKEVTLTATFEAAKRH